MNKKTVFSLLTLSVVVIVSACGTANPVETPIVETPVNLPPPEAPSIPTEDKPSLQFSESVESVGQGNLQQVIAYTFPAGTPDWTIPLKAAPYKKIDFNPGGLTPVGAVEIGDGSTTGVPAPGLYEVAINLENGAGQLSLIQDPQFTYPVDFQLIPQILNPERGEGAKHEQFKGLKPPQDVSVTISSDGVCFIVKTDDVPTYIRFCSVPSAPGEPAALLSVMDNFPAQYETLQASIDKALTQLKDLALFDQDAVMQTDQIISEMEHPQHLKGCVEKPGQANTCGSDIAVAPVQAEYFHQKLDEAKAQSTVPPGQLMVISPLTALFQAEGNFSIPVATVQILQQIQVSGGSPIQPGNYRMDYWYQVVDGEDVFFAATITGITTNSDGSPGVSVTNQPVPAVPATFINENESDPEQPGAQISTCRIFGICTFFQSSCS